MPAIPRRRFGRTELQMPVFSTGGMRYQHSWQDVPEEEIPAANQRNLEATIRRSLEVGINHIETARGYGTSEIQLGRILPGLPRDEMIIQTKVPPKADPKAFLEVFDQSMRNLQLDHVDLLSLHGINNRETLDWALGGCIEAAHDLVKAGRVRYVGFSTHGYLPQIIEAINTGAFDYINLHWYFVNDINWPAVLAARMQDMGVFIISPNDKGGKLYAPSRKLKRLCDPIDPMVFNAMYCLSRDEVHTLSIGSSRPSDYDAHIDGLKHYRRRGPLSREIATRLRAEMDRALGADWCANWHTGIPEHTDIPGDVNVREILRLWNYAKGLDLVEFAKMRYNMLGGAGHWFPGQNAKGLKVRAIREACRHSPFAKEIPGILKEAHKLLYEKPKKRLSEGG